jgi:dihydroxyacetone kinase-like predicted kinase
VLDFIYRLFKVAGIEDEVSFTRNVIINTNESVQVILQSAQYLSSDYITQKILTLLGDGDKAQEEIDKLNKYNFDRFTNDEPKEPEEEQTEQPVDDEE